MKAMADLTYGAQCAIRGIRVFFARPRLWPYALPPLLCVLVVYAGIFATVFCWLVPCLRGWVDGISLPGWLAWLQTVMKWSVSFFFWAAILLILFFCTGAFYEMFGNMLFDILVDRFEKEAYPEHPGANQTYGRVLRLTSGFIALTIWSNLIKIPLLILPLIPFVGKIVFCLYCSGVCGRSYFHDSAIRQGFHVSVLKRQVAKNRIAVLGFGIVAFFLESIPFLMPGLVVGGSILYHTRLFDGAQKPATPRMTNPVAQKLKS